MDRNTRRHSITPMFRRPPNEPVVNPLKINPLASNDQELSDAARIAIEDTHRTLVKRLHNDHSTQHFQDGSLPLSKQLKRIEDAHHMLARPMPTEKLRITASDGVVHTTTLQMELDRFRKFIEDEEAALNDLFKDLDDVNDEIARTTEDIENGLSMLELDGGLHDQPEVRAIEAEIAKLGMRVIDKLKDEERKRRERQRVIHGMLADFT